MRLFLAAMAAVAAASQAFAQAPALDGKARLASDAATYFVAEQTAQPIAKEKMRGAIVLLMADGKIDPSELDFVKEVAAQSPFTLSIDGTSGDLSFPAASDEAAALANLLMSPPNMHTLWHADPDKTEQLVEISRWGPAAHSRVTTFFGNKLYDAWGQSNILNAFSPFVDALGREWNAVKALKDPASVREGKLLLIAGCEFTKQKVVAEGKVPPENFLCAWMPGSL
ncbi:MAG: hypothetical protein Q8R82_09465 [Hyphomonadaceae bacterium]|nr:hypothetical protein [Hyphomonadaceae bacterium]